MATGTDDKLAVDRFNHITGRLEATVRGMIRDLDSRFEALECRVGELEGNSHRHPYQDGTPSD